MSRRARRALAGIAAGCAALALAACGSPSATPPTTTVPEAPDVLAYVTTIGTGGSVGLGNDVAVVNLTATSVAPLPIATGTFPAAVAVSAKLDTAYVANYASNTVTPIDLRDDRAGKAIPAGSGPAGIAITPNGEMAYVTDAGSTPIGHTVTPIDLVTRKPLTPISVGDGPEGIAITPNGKTAYVADTGAVVAGQTGSIGNTVTPIDLATRTALTPVTVGNAPEAVAISADGTTAFVANANSQSVSPIATASNTAGTPIGVKGNPQALAVSADGTTLWVADVLGKAGNLTPIDVSSATAGSPVTLGVDPTSLATEGADLYVVDNGSGTLDVCSSTGAVTKKIAIEGGPYAIALASLPADELPRALRPRAGHTSAHAVGGSGSGASSDTTKKGKKKVTVELGA